MFIAVDGMDCSGKSSIITPYISEKYNFKLVRDLKDGIMGQMLREVFMNEEAMKNASYESIAMIASAARSDIVNNIVLPELEQDKNVVIDRYLATSFVYNKGSHLPHIENILNYGSHNIQPDVYIIAYCNFEDVIKRSESRGIVDRWDVLSKKDYDDTLDRYKQYLDKIRIKHHFVNTSTPIEEVYENIDVILRRYRVL